METRAFLLVAAVAAVAATATPAPRAEAADPSLRLATAGVSLDRSVLRGRRTTVTVRYVVRGAAPAKGTAVVAVVLRRRIWAYEIRSRPRSVYAGVWAWTGEVRLPPSFAPGPYRLAATVTLRVGEQPPRMLHRTLIVRVS